MVWKYFKITNYIGIADGLGLETLEIDFSKCRNNICIIVGKNGSGKSTLEKALSPLPDSASDYVSGKTAEKCGCLLDNDGSIYEFNIISASDATGNRKTTKAFIRRNGEELNSNGNVTSYKEIIESEFDMDPNFMSLTRLSSDDRGLADKKPAERKKYVSSIVNCLETYNGINKCLSKKSSIFKSHINSLSSKISSIGDLETARMNLSGLDGRIVSLNSYIADIQRDIVKCESKVEDKDPDGSIQDTYTAIANGVDAVNKEIDNIKSSIKYRIGKLYPNGDIDSVNISYIESQIAECKDRLSDTKIKLESDQRGLDNYIREMDSLNTSISQKNARLDSMKIDTEYEKILAKINQYQATIDRQEEILKSCGLYGEEISKEEYLMIFTTLRRYREMVFKIYDINQEIISRAVHYECHDHPMDMINSEMNSLIDRVEADEKYLKNCEDNIVKYTGMLESIKILDKRPKDCKIDTCPFIFKALEDATADPGTMIQYYIERVAETKASINESKAKLDVLVETTKVMEMIDSIVSDANSNKAILSKFHESYTFCDRTEFITRISNHNSFNEVEDCDKYIQLADSIAGYNNNKNILKDLLAQKQVYDSKNEIITELISEIGELQKKLSDAEDKIREYNASIEFNRGLIRENENRLSKLEELYEYFIKLKDKLDERENLGKQFVEIKSSIAAIKDSIDRLNRLRHDLDKAIAEIKPLQEERDQLAYAIKRAEEYDIELQEYRGKFNIVETLKKYSSPTSGIQTIYMNLYMNKTLSLANDLLKYLFNGYLELMPYVINEDEFRIPVRHGNGFISDDISSCSTAQICMISMVVTISLSLQSSGIFNIFRFDEIDGGLDTDNRLYFFDILKRMSIELGIQQMIVISHSIESNMSGVDVIKLASPNNIDYDFDGVNIIYDYKEGR